MTASSRTKHAIANKLAATTTNKVIAAIKAFSSNDSLVEATPAAATVGLSMRQPSDFREADAKCDSVSQRELGRKRVPAVLMLALLK
jgi:hypothetical protein